MYDTYMSTPGNTAKLGTTHNNIQTAQRGPSLVGSEPTICISQQTIESELYPLCQPGWTEDEFIDFSFCWIYLLYMLSFSFMSYYLVFYYVK